MAVDKKSQHVGNHGGVYTDMDGMTKQFTMVDHDRHTTRLKLGREYKSSPELPPTPQEILVRDILLSGMNANPLFIKLFDTEIATKYQFERFKKGVIVENLRGHGEEPGWFKDVERIFKEVLKEQKKEFETYLKKKYEL